MNLEKSFRNPLSEMWDNIICVLAAIIFMLIFLMPFAVQVDGYPIKYPNWFSGWYIFFGCAFFACTMGFYWHSKHARNLNFTDALVGSFLLASIIAIMWPVIWFFPFHKKIKKFPQFWWEK